MPESSSGSEPTPPSPPSSAADRAPASGGTVFPLVLSVAAALSCWNLFGAPFAIVTAAAATALSLWRARGRSGAARVRLRIAAVVSALSLAAGVFVLATSMRSAGTPAALPGAADPQMQEAAKALDEAERRTAERRDAARRELERAPPAPATPPDRRDNR